MIRKRTATVILLLLLILSMRSEGGETIELPNPLENVQAGQWVHYRLNTLFGAVEQTQTVLDVQGEGEDRILVIKTEMTIDGEVLDVTEEPVTYKAVLEMQAQSLADAGDVELFIVQTDVMGERVPAVRVDFTQDGQRCHLYLSERIPLIGLIRMLIDGMDEPALELLGYGE